MHKETSVTEVVGKALGILTFYFLISLGLKYAFDFTWFQAGMITLMWSYLENGLYKLVNSTK